MTQKRLLSKSIPSSLHSDGELQCLMRVTDLELSDEFDDLSAACEWLPVKER